MQTKRFHTLPLLFLVLGVFGQQSNLELTFTAIDSTAYAQLDSIRVMNLTQDGDTVLYWPDTTLLLDLPVSLRPDLQNSSGFKVFQNYPNPVTTYTNIPIQVPENGTITIDIRDPMGRVILKYNRFMTMGQQVFRFFPVNKGLYLFTAQFGDESSSIRILQAGSNPAGGCRLEYAGCENRAPGLKGKSRDIRFQFNPGDELLCIGYRDTLQSGMLDIPVASDTLTFQFAFNIPCPGMPAIEYEGRDYETVQLFSQCWLKDNLNIGNMILGTVEMADNEVLEKYCYNNDTNNCASLGGLYQWDEMMQYTHEEGGRGICPEGWHLPGDAEWKILEGAVDGLYGIGDQTWDLYGLRGFDAGMHLKSSADWSGNGNGTDRYGFTGLPGGYRYSNGYFYYRYQHGLWWTSTEGNPTSAWNRYLSHDNAKVDRDYGDNKKFAFSVRCIRNE